jgi:hypothetical protein
VTCPSHIKIKYSLAGVLLNAKIESVYKLILQILKVRCILEVRFISESELKEFAWVRKV